MKDLITEIVQALVDQPKEFLSMKWGVATP